MRINCVYSQIKVHLTCFKLDRSFLNSYRYQLQPVLGPNSSFIDVTTEFYEITSIADIFKRIRRVASPQQNTWFTNYIRVLKIPYHLFWGKTRVFQTAYSIKGKISLAFNKIPGQQEILTAI